MALVSSDSFFDYQHHNLEGRKEAQQQTNKQTERDIVGTMSIAWFIFD
jgi:hypothetical protein